MALWVFSMFFFASLSLLSLSLSLSRTGSSVGLLLGASVLTVVETLEWGCFSLIRLCHRRLVSDKVIKHETSVLATNPTIVRVAPSTPL